MIEITRREFREKVLDSHALTLVYFGASWSPPCLNLDEYLEVTLGGRLAAFRVNVDAERLLTQEQEVTAVPTVALYSSGQQIDFKVGAMSSEQLEDFIDMYL